MPTNRNLSKFVKNCKGEAYFFITDNFQKVLEKIIYSQLYAYFIENNLLTEQQYGFRAQHSTELASVKLVDNIIKKWMMHMG